MFFFEWLKSSNHRRSTFKRSESWFRSRNLLLKERFPSETKHRTKPERHEKGKSAMGCTPSTPAVSSGHNSPQNQAPKPAAVVAKPAKKSPKANGTKKKKDKKRKGSHGSRRSSSCRPKYLFVLAVKLLTKTCDLKRYEMRSVIIK